MDEDLFPRSRPHVNVGVIGGGFSSKLAIASAFLACSQSHGIAVRSGPKIEEVLKSFKVKREYSPFTQQLNGSFPDLYPKVGSKFSDYICPDIIRTNYFGSYPFLDMSGDIDFKELKSSLWLYDFIKSGAYKQDSDQ